MNEKCIDCGSQEELHDYTDTDLKTVRVCLVCYYSRNGEVYGPCEDCGIMQPLEKHSTEGLLDMMLCDPCGVKRRREESDHPGDHFTVRDLEC